MPTRADIQAATPKCERMLVRHHMAERCCNPLRYNVPRDVWACPHHGDISTGAILGARLVRDYRDEIDGVLPWLATAKR